MNALRCPDCGHPNPPESRVCGSCGFPLELEAGSPTPIPLETTSQEEPAAATAPEASAGPPGEPRTPIRPPRPRRPRRGSTEALSLWLVFGTLMALVVLFIAIKANVDRARAPVEGSSRLQQARADSLLDVLERDSSDVQAHVRLGDVLYDTGNWSEAIVHYRAALRRDSTLVTTLVDLGVCYYNLGHPDDAERHFRLALARDAHQPVALFNLGIVHERRNDYKTALEYFHRSLNMSPPEAMRPAIIDAMSRVQEKAGIEAPPLPQGEG